MLKAMMEREDGIAVLEPDHALSAEDFAQAAALIDPYIEEHGYLNGLIIHVDSFPGWASFASLLTHLRFVREHHRKIRRVALVTDSTVMNAAETIGSHLVAAEVRTFGFDELSAARQWILDQDQAG